MSKKLDEYFFIKVSEAECIKAKDEQEALQKAIKFGIVDPEFLHNYAVVTQDCDGQLIAGTLDMRIKWQND